jgi:hypothetical protein
MIEVAIGASYLRSAGATRATRALAWNLAAAGATRAVNADVSEREAILRFVRALPSSRVCGGLCANGLASRR